VELTRYFLEMKFNPDTNKDNVLGTGGKLAM
jgi:ubiquitin carboxyl-terminal hydrolase 4/11/15